MKSNINTIVAIAATSFTSVLTPNCHALDWSFLEGDISGILSMNTVAIKKESNFSTVDDEPVRDMDSSAKSETIGTVAPVFNVNYKLRELPLSFFIGSSLKDVAIGDVALELGVGYKLKNGTALKVSVLPTVVDGTVWADPYMVGDDRVESDKTGTAVRTQLANISNTALSVDALYSSVDIENESSGELSGDSSWMSTLNRNADFYRIKTSYKLDVDDLGATLLPYATVSRYDAQGSATAYDAFEAGVTGFKRHEDSAFTATISAKRRRYDAKNPIVGVKREDNEVGIVLGFEKYGIFDNPRLSLVSLASHKVSNSNATFFDEKESFVSLGGSFRF